MANEQSLNLLGSSSPRKEKEPSFQFPDLSDPDAVAMPSPLPTNMPQSPPIPPRPQLQNLVPQLSRHLPPQAQE
ncbi:hypothetical protein PAXINDRAFT_16944 [Paxillus involutus ATCC 200175]|uniref:Uncharacterized protein n=1 Tax=Paxillus involutus ATCC 200175 TaxID=664439 RepID=A0A0C9TGR9_PAXIN|nr:hypothetical protein PAXINDRAFT_16944 [Paxillus involutus ATCC 200175]